MAEPTFSITEQEYLNYKKFNEENKDYLKVKSILEYKDQNGDTFLHIAAREGDKGIVSILVKEVDDIDSRGEHYKTALHVAVEHGHKDIVSMLLEAKANPNSGFLGLYNVIDEAAKQGDKDIFTMLLNEGAIVNKAVYRSTAEFATTYGHQDIADLLDALEVRLSDNLLEPVGLSDQSSTEEL